MPSAPKANPTSTAAGKAASARADAGQVHRHHHHQERRRVERCPAASPSASSPRAISNGCTGVAITPSYSFMYFIFPKKLKVVSASAPVIADEASIAGATNAAYETTRPPGSGEVADQRADADADGEQVEHRLHEAGDQHAASRRDLSAATLRSATDADRRDAAWRRRPAGAGRA